MAAVVVLLVVLIVTCVFLSVEFAIKVRNERNEALNKQHDEALRRWKAIDTKDLEHKFHFGFYCSMRKENIKDGKRKLLVIVRRVDKSDPRVSNFIKLVCDSYESITVSDFDDYGTDISRFVCERFGFDVLVFWEGNFDD